MTRDHLIRGLVAVVLLAGAVWVASRTEWVDVDVRDPATGEAAKNDLYAVQQLARRLGAEVQAPGELTRMPPPGATLLLSSWGWDLFPERGQQLRDWVRQGGHLVLFTSMLDNEQLKDWVPMRQAHAGMNKSTLALTASSLGASQPTDKGLDDTGLTVPLCHDVVEPATVAPRYPPSRLYSLCSIAGDPSTRPMQSALWQLDGLRGPELMRVAYGQGSVTTLPLWGVFSNQYLLQGDNALVAAAALQMRRGAVLWFVTEEARPPFLRWLWQQGRWAILLGGLALGLALWRGAVRFGPLASVPIVGRRSMAEQISGTAQFLHQRGGLALHAAQVRALDESARLHVRHYDQLDRSSRAQAIARLTGLDGQALGLALDRSIPRRRIDLPPTLELLETARRLLAHAPQRPAT